VSSTRVSVYNTRARVSSTSLVYPIRVEGRVYRTCARTRHTIEDRKTCVATRVVAGKRRCAERRYHCDVVRDRGRVRDVVPPIPAQLDGQRKAFPDACRRLSWYRVCERERGLEGGRETDRERGVSASRATQLKAQGPSRTYNESKKEEERSAGVRLEGNKQAGEKTDRAHDAAVGNPACLRRECLLYHSMYHSRLTSKRRRREERSAGLKAAQGSRVTNKKKRRQTVHTMLLSATQLVSGARQTALS